LIGHFAIAFAIIMPADISIIAPTSQVRDLRHEFKTDQPALDLFERDARCPRIRILNERTRAFVNLFGALGGNQHFEEPIITYDIIHGISLLLLSY